MSTAAMTEQSKRVLQAFVTIDTTRQVATVQLAAQYARVSYMDTYDAVNELFGAGLITHDLKPTEAGRRAAK